MEINAKDRAAKILREKGFDSENVDGVVITYFQKGEDKSYYAEKVKEIEEIFKEIGYGASKGYHIVSKREEEKEGE